MEVVSIKSGRRFSRDAVQHSPLLTGDIGIDLICFEAGQKGDENLLGTDTVYQVLEGELLIHCKDDSVRLGEGRLAKLPAKTAHRLENAGGGLLVVMAMRPR